jgi:hypothetical protein
MGFVWARNALVGILSRIVSSPITALVDCTLEKAIRYWGVSVKHLNYIDCTERMGIGQEKDS